MRKPGQRFQKATEPLGGCIDDAVSAPGSSKRLPKVPSGPAWANQGQPTDWASLRPHDRDTRNLTSWAQGSPNPWAAPDWAQAGPDGTFGNRFDDPGATYRVVYASSQRLGCFLETLARFRIDLKLAAELAEIQGDADHLPQGEVPVEWLANRIMGLPPLVENTRMLGAARGSAV